MDVVEELIDFDFPLIQNNIPHDRSLSFGIEEEYGKPISELSTECPLYWFMARAMRLGSKEDSEWFWETGEIVWC
jgi:hypothetical protein